MNQNRRQNIAVIGSGISGLGSAWYLSGNKYGQHRVTLFEKANRLGGHTNTRRINVDGQSIDVDTGFIVYNEPNYPLLTALFAELNVETQHTDMSFAVSLNQGAHEYAGNDLNTLFGQRKNLLSPSHWRMVRDILRFNKQAKADLLAHRIEAVSLRDYLDKHRISDIMRERYLLPMGAAIWSCPTQTMQDFPARSFIQFFDNHGLLSIKDRPQWQTVVGGSSNYIDKMLAHNRFEIRLNAELVQADSDDDNDDGGVTLTFRDGKRQTFDKVVFAGHGDEMFGCLSDRLKASFAPLANVSYQANTAYLHRDKALLPKRKLLWSSWNYLRDTHTAEHNVAVSYWMNRLQHLPTDTPIVVTLNPISLPKAELTDEVIEYAHPIFDAKTIAAQHAMPDLQGKHGCYFAGAYLGYGFHEDGLHSAFAAANRIGNMGDDG